MKKKKGNSLLKKILMAGLKIAALVGVVIVLFIFSIHLGLFGKLPSEKVLKNIEHQQASKIVDMNGEQVGYLFRVYRSNVEFDELPDHLIAALLSTEDARFYNHNGIDYRSLGRVLVKTVLLQDRSAGGGSTITQQLVKNLFPREINNKFDILVAKIKELLIARKIEKIYEKNQILALYLNTVNFPDNTFGIGAAAQTFFSKEVNDLTIEESALLVGSLKANHTYNPRLFPERSKQRRDIVLSQMYKYDKLEEEAFNRIIEKPITLNYNNIQPNYGQAAYFREQVRKQLIDWAEDYEEASGEEIDIYGDGLIIHTTLDNALQHEAEESMKRHLKVLQRSFEKEWGNSGAWHKYEVYSKYAKQTNRWKELKKEGKAENQIMDILTQKEKRTIYNIDGVQTAEISIIDSIKNSIRQLQAGFLALDPANGDVRAYIGGVDYQHFKYDHVVQSKRQVGSTFKPFVYAAALENGVDPCEYFAANAVAYSDQEGWKPDNSDDEDYRYINVTMKEALRKSMNTVSVKVLEAAGIQNTIDIAERAGIKTDLPAVPSLALGTAELSMMELATAYTAFVNNGYYVAPRMITKITTATGEVLATFETEKSDKPAFDKETATIILEMMRNVVDKGTASRLRWKYKIRSQIAGKTGTTQQNRDGWFVGLTPNLVAISWVGADDGAISFRSTALGQGASSALPIYAGLIKQLEEDKALNRQYLPNFRPSDADILRQMDCPPIKEDGFFKKIFSNKDKDKDFNEDGDKKKGNLFKRIKEVFK